MYKYLGLQLLGLLLSINLYAQHTENFEITLPKAPISGSLYNKITIVDARPDSTDMGIVQTGAFNRKAKVVPAVSVSAQLYKVFGALNNADAGNGEMLLQLRQLSFAELTAAMSEKGYCYFRADAYARQGEGYKKISSIDTVILIKSMDVTRPLFRKGNEIVTGFLTTAMQKQPVSATTYTYQDVLNVETIEKQGMKLYTTLSYAEGVYLTYTAFMNQTPDKQATVETDDSGKLTTVKVTDDKGKLQKVKAQDVYALVHNGLAYVGTRFGYYPLKKVDNNFLFTGKASVNAKTGDVIAASIFFGVIGGLVASNAEATFEMKLDHINGGFVRLREVTAAN